MKKYLLCFLSLFVFSNCNACQKCYEELQNLLQVMEYYESNTESDYWRIYMAGTVNGITISLQSYAINHPNYD